MPVVAFSWHGLNAFPIETLDSPCPLYCPSPLSDQLNVPCCTLRRWAAEYEADGEDAFPGSGNPVANKDYEILKLKKENEELRKEVAILKKFRAFLRQAQA